jgi:extracellular factor (EF) 3-hydroxypalmitic acid methyl ester biosynthesis protein
MNLADQDRSAYLVTGAGKIPILASCGSKHTVLVRFLNGHRFEDGSQFCNFQIRFNGTEFHLGPCRLRRNSRTDGYDASLAFLADVYNLEALFAEKKLISLRDSFSNLPLVLDYKSKIKPFFKDYTANLSYDLNVYRSFFDELDREYAKEPPEAGDHIQRVLIDTEGRKFMRFLDEKLAELERMVSGFTREEHECHGYFFRRLLWNVIMCAPFMRRTNLKPRGYAGDYIMMKMLYLNRYEGDSTFAKLMHKHPVEHPAAEAVRNRRKLITQTLRKAQADRSRKGKRMKILSVACGPACELKDILISPEECEKYHFTLLDQDQSALDEAASLIAKLENEWNTRVHVTYLNESVRTMLKGSTLAEKWGQFDFIYSMGLFDYLTPPVAAGILGKLCQLLEKDGDLLIGNFHISNPSRCYMEYWLDWVLYYRNEEEFLRLVPDKTGGQATVLFEDTKSQMFLHVKR